LKEKHVFHPTFVELRRHAALNLPLFPHRPTSSGGNPALLEMIVIYSAISLKSLRGEGGYCSETDIYESVFMFSGK
jgi:hypothetical protein